MDQPSYSRHLAPVISIFLHSLSSARQRSTKDADVKQTVCHLLAAGTGHRHVLRRDARFVDTLRLMSTCQCRICEFRYIRSATHVPFVYTSQNTVHGIRTFVTYLIMLIRNNN